MSFADFVDQVLSDHNIYFDGRPDIRIRERYLEIEEDENLSPEERSDAIMSLRMASLIDPSRQEQMEEVCGDLARFLHPGYVLVNIVYMDYDFLGEEFWNDLDLHDDLGESCYTSYYDGPELNEPFGVARALGYMKAKDKETAESLLHERVEQIVRRHKQKLAA